VKTIFPEEKPVGLLMNAPPSGWHLYTRFKLNVTVQVLAVVPALVESIISGKV
jgi:hypothetical protein